VPTSKLQIRKELTSKMFGPTEPVVEHIGKLEKIRRKLAAAGAMVSDPDFILIILDSLDSRFDKLRTGISR
jgi:hypothetical protein